MEVLVKQVRRAQRLLLLQQFLGVLVWFWFCALLVASLAIGFSKVWPTGVDAMVWAACWIGGSIGVSTLAAIVYTFLRRKSRFDSAVEIDRRFGLKERVSSTLSLRPEELESPAGQALVSDAIGRVSRIDVSERFGLQIGRKALLPLAPALAAFGLAFLVSDPTRENVAEATPVNATVDHVKKATEALEKKLGEKPKAPDDEEDLKEAELFEQLRQGVRQIVKEKVDQKQALVALNDLSQKIEDQKKKRDANELKQQLNQMKDLDKGPADDLAKAMKNGDFGKAVDELKKLKEKLADEKMNEQEKQDLVKQLEQMQDRLQKMADAHQQAKQQLQQEIDRARQAGQQDQAEKLQQKLDKLQQQQQQMQQAAQMGKQLGNCAKCMKNGNNQGAKQAMDQLGQALNQMKQADNALEMLDDALAQVGECKNAMACKECNGAGCKACQGQGKQGQGKPGGKPGNGLGAGIGTGSRPENRNKTSLYDSTVKQNVLKGASVVIGTAEGPNRKGEVTEEIKAQFESAEHEAADPLSGQRLPHDYREHAKKYFDLLRDSQK